MAANTHAEMHADHRQWTGDLSLWCDDIGIWQKELNLVVAELTRLGNVLREHQAAIDAHTQTVHAHAQQMKEHEHALAAFEAGGLGDNRLLLLAKEHKREAAQHAQQREAHEGIKKRQTTLIAQWSLVIKVLSELV